MASDPLEELRRSGHPVDDLSDQEREVLASLSEEEVATLISIAARVQAVKPKPGPKPEGGGGGGTTGVIIF